VKLDLKAVPKTLTAIERLMQLWKRSVWKLRRVRAKPTFSLTVVTKERRIDHDAIEVTLELNYSRQSVVKKDRSMLCIPGSRKGCAKS